MSDYSTRYYQLTSDILIEYNYATETGIDCNIDVNSLEKTSVITNDVPEMKVHLINKNTNGINLYESNFVIPTNNSQTSFIKLQHRSGIQNIFSSPNDKININSYEYDTDGNTYSLSFDKIRFHFTSRNFMGEYDGLIFQAYVYDKKKSKIYLMSFLLSKLDDFILNESPMLLNQKIYTTYIDVKIPSVYKILKSYNPNFGYNNNSKSESIVYNSLKNWLGINDGNNQLMQNTPIILNLFGVKHEISKNNYTYYLTENISSISISCKDSLENIYIDISEATDGDYFIIQPKISDGTSFSDYIYKLDESPEKIIILHELKLIEHYITYDNNIKSVETHQEQFVVNTTTNIIDEHGQNYITINEDALDEPMYYRPICRYGSRCFKFTIQDTLKIINTVDSTTIVKNSSYTYDNPSKYGKKMQQINMHETPSIINVYNKRTDGEIDADNTSIRITNTGGTGPKIETQIHNTTSFLESANIVVSIQQVSAIDVETVD